MKESQTFETVDIDSLPANLKAAVDRAGWSELTPVQSASIPYVMAKRDIMVQSRTGTGKTGAFILPILEGIDLGRDECQALVLVPTRELAVQVFQAAETLSGGSGVRVVAVYGGVGYGPQIDAFNKGAHIVVGTPGRILDHLIRRSLSLEGIRTLVFDEADRMLSMGFYPDMKRVKGFLPKRRVNCCMFSATYPPSVMRLAQEFLHDPEVLSLSHDHVHVVDTEHVFYIVPGMKKDRALAKIIEVENPDSAIIFCNTKAQVNYVAVVLRRFGYDADELSADLPQAAREKVLERVRRGGLRFLVATDVAARGIDIPELSHVILYETPEDPEAYIHRAGRTGRAGASGEAISLVTDMEKLDLMRIAKRYKIELDERALPTDEELEKIIAQRATALLETEVRSLDKLQMDRLRKFIPLAQSLAKDDDESVLLAMLLDEFYKQKVHQQHVEQPKPAVVEEKRVAPRENEGEPGRRSSRRRRR